MDLSMPTLFPVWDTLPFAARCSEVSLSPFIQQTFMKYLACARHLPKPMCSGEQQGCESSPRRVCTHQTGLPPGCLSVVGKIVAPSDFHVLMEGGH